MVEILVSNDPVLLSWAEAMLRAEGIDCVLFDAFTSGIEGGIGAFPRRLMVLDEDRDVARRLLEFGEAGLARHLAMGTTADAILGGRIRLLQPEAGYRAAIDPVLLAAAVPVRAGGTVLDVGVGSAAAALCLAARAAECRIVGLDRATDSLMLAAASIRLNRFEDRVSLVRADLSAHPLPFAANVFDHVMTNPPYLAAEVGSPPASASRNNTDRESIPLAAWLDACLAPLRFKGSLTVVHRADRTAEIMAALAGKAGGIELYPLWPTAGAPFARRVIVRARKGSRAPTKVWRGMVLHGGDGTYTAAADLILRDGAALMMDGPLT